MINRIDSWWSKNADKRRIDRGPSYVVANFGMNCSALSMMIIGPVPESSLSELPDNLQDALSIILWMGTIICLGGSLSGSRWFFPNMQRRKSYRIGIAGNPAVISSIIFYGWAIFAHVPNAASALGAILGPLLGVGASINMFYFWLEIRRITRNVVRIHEYRHALEISDHALDSDNG